MTETEMLSEEQLKEIEARTLTGHFPSLETVRALCQTVRALRADVERWKKSHEEVRSAESVRNSQLLDENTALREHLREQRETIKFWQRHITRMGKLLGTVAMDTEVEEAVKRLQSQLAQVEKERDDLQTRLVEEVSKRINSNAERMEQSQKVSQAELEHHCRDNRLTDTQRGSYEG